jgi:DNA mismatch repair protein MutS2
MNQQQEKPFFIQPEEVVELNYKLYDLIQAEKKEIYRILKNLSDVFRPFVSLLREYQKILAYYDFVRAKAKVAILLQAIAPEINTGKQSDLREAFHPLLYLKNKKESRKTIPLQLKLDDENRILLISGPNAGGKSVCLKTLGLLQLMFQSGLLLPVHQNTSLRIYKKLFVDIGDNQSIDNDLSTYTGKLTYMKHFLEQANSHSLMLIDEFGSGTDPKPGGVIAETMLESINRKKAYGVITTHYTNLKLFASENNGLLNGAMLFDLKTLSPTYQLEIGKPGSSYAFELVQKIGFHQDFIDQVKSKLQGQELDFDHLLVKLQHESKQIESQSADLKKRREQAEKLLEENKKLKQELQKSKNEIITESKVKAQAYINNVNKQFEKLLKQWQNEKDIVKKESKAELLSKKIKEESKVIDNQLIKQSKKSKPRLKKSSETIRPGMSVVMDDRTDIGYVESVDSKTAVVIFGSLRAKLALSRLKAVEIQKPAARAESAIIRNQPKDSSFTPVLDIRGHRKAESLTELDRFIDEALLSHYKSFKIIHGHGDGILRTSVRKHLTTYSFVKNIQSESQEMGGEGATLFELE